MFCWEGITVRRKEVGSIISTCLYVNVNILLVCIAKRNY